MPGQPAWTLTEMLECNLPLCWAGGGDCNVGPAQSFAALFYYLSPLGLQTIDFIIKKKTEEPCSGVFFGAVFSIAVFFQSSFFPE